MNQEEFKRDQGLRNLLQEWLRFSEDVTPGCKAGQDWLDSLRSRSNAAAHPKSMFNILTKEQVEQGRNKADDYVV